MRLRCRFGWHSWGKWSKYWSTQINTPYGVNYLKLYRSLRCELCDAHKNKSFGLYNELTDDKLASDPVWDTDDTVLE